MQYTPIIARQNDKVLVYDEDLADYLRLKVANAKKYKFPYTMGNGALLTFEVNVRGWRIIDQWAREFLRRSQ